MKSPSRQKRLQLVLLGLFCVLISSSGIPGNPGYTPDRLGGEVDVDFQSAGWTLRSARKLPENITSLITVPDARTGGVGIFLGTGPVGSVYRLNSALPISSQTLIHIAVGLGERLQFGTCEVSRLAVRDLDRDGILELIAETSQIQPRGRPRLCVWSLDSSTILRGVSRPDIQSSWSHGLGFGGIGEAGTERIISTYCGYGEIVEYELASTVTPSGFRNESLSWRVVGQLPASGEGTVTADVDNDGVQDLCVATGFAEGRGAIHIYDMTANGIETNAKQIVDEGGAFGNVRFMVADVAGDGTQEVFAWWCTGMADGACVAVRYRLAQGSVAARCVLAEGDAAELWPVDGQIAVADLNQDGEAEVWFATASGRLWQYESSATPRLRAICRVPGGIGPIATGTYDNQPVLYISSGAELLLLMADDAQKR